MSLAEKTTRPWFFKLSAVRVNSYLFYRNYFDIRHLKDMVLGFREGFCNIIMSFHINKRVLWFPRHYHIYIQIRPLWALTVPVALAQCSYGRWYRLYIKINCNWLHCNAGCYFASTSVYQWMYYWKLLLFYLCTIGW